MRASEPRGASLLCAAPRPGLCALVFAIGLLAAGAFLVSQALADLGAVRDVAKTFSDAPTVKNGRAGSWIVRGDHMVPGQRVRGRVRIKNGGRRTGVLYVRPRRALDTPGPGGAPLSTRLLLAIRRIDRRGGLHTVWKGYLSEMGKVRVGVLRPGAVRRYRFVVLFRVRPPARGSFRDNAFQDSRFATDFVWQLVPLR